MFLPPPPRTREAPPPPERRRRSPLQLRPVLLPQRRARVFQLLELQTDLVLVEHLQNAVMSKLWRSDPNRKTRFHTEDGKLCLFPREIVRSLLMYSLNKMIGYRPSIPWYVPDANRFLQQRDWSGCTCFEYGSGYSTPWYARRFSHVYTVEHDREWLSRVDDLVKSFDNVTIFACSDIEDYVRAVDRTGVEYFDLISIDGIFRNECFEYSVGRLKPNGILVLDNTDVDDRKPMITKLQDHFADEDILEFHGYPNGLLHASRTTICVGR